MLDVLTDTNRLTDTDLITLLQSTHVDSNRHFAAFLVSLAEFDRRGLALRAGASSTSVWLDRTLGIARSTSYGYLHTSRVLADFPLLTDKFLAGELSYSKVRLLESHLTEENEADLVALALRLTYNELRMALAGRGNSPEGPAKDRLSIRIDEHGRYLLEANLSPALGAQLSAALKLGELANQRDLAETDPERLADDEQLSHLLDETPSATRFGQASDALSGFIGMMNLARSSTSSAQRAPGAQVQVVMTEDGHAFLPGNPAAPAAALSGLMSNADFRGHLLDARGVHLKMGRRRRLVSGGQELALLVSWLFQCATPGCSHTRFLQFHHIRDWAKGGLTDCENLIPLCSRCHSMVSTGELRLAHHPTDAHRLVFGFSDGSTFVSRNRGLPQRDTRVKLPTIEEPEYREWGEGFDESTSVDSPA